MRPGRETVTLTAVEVKAIEKALGPKATAVMSVLRNAGMLPKAGGVNDRLLYRVSNCDLVAARSLMDWATSRLALRAPALRAATALTRPNPSAQRLSCGRHAVSTAVAIDPIDVVNCAIREYLRNPSLLMRARAQATVRVWKKRPELQAHSRIRIQSGCGLPVATGKRS